MPTRTALDRRLPTRRTVLACLLGLPLLSLLVLREPGYDATAWLIWGRQVTEGTLATVGGPSWKPLPVAFTTLFALAGDHVAPVLWLVVARTGGLAALLAAFGVARRLTGSATSGYLAAGGLALASDFLFNAARGDSEGLLVAAALGAVLAHLHGRRHVAFALGLAAGLLRPEVWPMLAVYGAWLVHVERDARTVGLVAASGLAVLAAWFVPEKLGSGDWLRAATRAQNPVPGSPGTSSFPFLMTFLNGSIMLSVPVYAGAVKAVLVARREGDRRVLGLAVAATVLMLIVALLAQNGFTGNLRYVTLPGSVLCVLAGAGLPPLARDVQRRGLVRPALAVTGLSVVIATGVVGWGAYRLARDEQAYGRDLPAAIARAGGVRAVRACGPISANPFGRQAVAWRLHLPQRGVSTRHLRRGTLIAMEDAGFAARGPIPERFRLGAWTVRSTCPGLGG